jgi:hypothetical protein
MYKKCCIFHCQNKIEWVRLNPPLVPDFFCSGHMEASKGFTTDNITWHSYKDYTEEQEKIKRMEECVESGQAYERSRQIEMRDILYSDIAQKGWLEIAVCVPPLNEIVILGDDLGSYAGFRVGKSEYKKLNTAGISIKLPIPVYWMPLPKRK